jgi:hypothetical protein
MTLMGATQFCSSTAELWYATLSVLPQAISPPVVILAFKLEKVLTVFVELATVTLNIQDPGTQLQTLGQCSSGLYFVFTSCNLSALLVNISRHCCSKLYV